MPEIVFPPVEPTRNRSFLESSEGRSIRILSEYMEPYQRLSNFRVRDTIVFFGSSRILSPNAVSSLLDEAKAIDNERVLRKAEMAQRMSEYYNEARLLSRKLTVWSKKLERVRSRFVICSGGGGGIMEAANRGASEERGLNMGLGIELPYEQEINPYITRHLAFNFRYFFMRKFWLINMAKAFIFFPGGFGTIDELFEVLTLMQTGKIDKNIPLVLFGKEYWDSIVNFDSLVHHGMISNDDLDLIFHTSSIDEAFEYISSSINDLLKETTEEEET